MTWIYNNKEISENDIYDIVAEHYSEEDFNSSLDSMYEPVCLFGKYYYDYSTALRRLDPVLYRTAYLEDVDYIANEIINAQDEEDSYGFGIRWVEEEEDEDEDEEVDA